MEAKETFNVRLEEFESQGPKKKKIDPKVEDEAITIVGRQFPISSRASEKQFEDTYEKARNLYNSGKFKEALPYFLILKTGDSSNAKYAFAIAACYHMMKEYKKAIEQYVISSVLDPHTPLPFYYSSDCFIRMNDPFGALITLDVGLKRASPKYTMVVQRMESMVKKLEKELEERQKESTTSFIPPSNVK